MSLTLMYWGLQAPSRVGHKGFWHQDYEYVGTLPTWMDPSNPFEVLGTGKAGRSVWSGVDWNLGGLPVCRCPSATLQFSVTTCKVTLGCVHGMVSKFRGYGMLFSLNFWQYTEKNPSFQDPALPLHRRDSGVQIYNTLRC